MYFSAQKWAFYFGKSADFNLSISECESFLCGSKSELAFFMRVATVWATRIFIIGGYMKKLLTFFLALILMILPFSACKKDDGKISYQNGKLIFEDLDDYGWSVLSYDLPKNLNYLRITTWIFDHTK